MMTYKLVLVSQDRDSIGRMATEQFLIA